MEIQTQNQNQQLTANQQKLSTAIAKVGNLPQISFVKKTIELQKIRNMDVVEVREGLGIIFVRAVNLLGIKEKISQINKEDIRDMILLKFKSFSLEEIDYAFKLDRWSGEPIQHFQLFNSEYVAKVLTKYKNWLRETRANNNLPLEAKQEKPKMSDEEKQIIVINGIIDCFEDFKENETIPIGKTYIYDYFFEKGALPVHTQTFKQNIKRKASKWMYENRLNLNKDRKTNRQIINDIKSGKNQMKTKCKEIVLKTFFHKLIATNTKIQDVL